MRLKKYFLGVILIGFLMLFIVYPFRYRIIRKIKGAIESHTLINRSNKVACFNCASVFVDDIQKHREAYKKEGIKPQKHNSGFNKFLKSGKLSIVKNSEFYTIAKLSHSSPYLMPKAISFLQDLSKRYKSKCNKKNIQLVPFTISSLTRTKTDVLELNRVNKNAIIDSAHLRGKTFDVNYYAFNHNKAQLKCFIASL